jgi:hypothetical protein
MFSGSSSTASANSTLSNASQPNGQSGGLLGTSAYLVVFGIILIVLVVKYFSNLSSFVKSF